MTTTEDRTQEIAIPDLAATGVVPLPAQVRTLATGPNGNNGTQVSAALALELGAMLGAIGVEQGAVAALIEFLQQITMTTHLQALPTILDKIKDANKARLNRLIQQVQLLPEMSAVNQGVWSKITTAPGQLASTVSRDAVKNLLVAAMNEPMNRY